MRTAFLVVALAARTAAAAPQDMTAASPDGKIVVTEQSAAWKDPAVLYVRFKPSASHGDVRRVLDPQPLRVLDWAGVNLVGLEAEGARACADAARAIAGHDGVERVTVSPAVFALLGYDGGAGPRSPRPGRSAPRLAGVAARLSFWKAGLGRAKDPAQAGTLFDGGTTRTVQAIAAVRPALYVGAGALPLQPAAAKSHEAPGSGGPPPNPQKEWDRERALNTYRIGLQDVKSRQKSARQSFKVGLLGFAVGVVALAVSLMEYTGVGYIGAGVFLAGVGLMFGGALLVAMGGATWLYYSGTARELLRQRYVEQTGEEPPTSHEPGR